LPSLARYSIWASYHALFKGTYTITTANLNPDDEPDILCNLEEKLSIDDSSYDGVLLINVLEHIFEYRQLAQECARVVRPGGTIVVVVPFLFPVHPSPDDFHRYTKSALEKMLEKSGFSDITVTALGTGVFAVRWILIERLLPGFLRPLSYIANPLTRVADALFMRLARLIGKKYQPSDYPLGYVAVARRV
jgi:SAM-dependent methyltransferase